MTELFSDFSILTFYTRFFETIVTVMNNPASFAKHQANPKVAPVIAKMMAKFGGAGGAGGAK